mmetsp:Transcript_29055/g.74728  ORF Transcript_29055/g.74728 Transcript_29055/m.74728 type:complete len:133 (-) Transcript_29055:1195-1593(-)
MSLNLLLPRRAEMARHPCMQGLAAVARTQKTLEKLERKPLGFSGHVISASCCLSLGEKVFEAIGAIEERQRGSSANRSRCRGCSSSSSAAAHLRVLETWRAGTCRPRKGMLTGAPYRPSARCIFVAILHALK